MIRKTFKVRIVEEDRNSADKYVLETTTTDWGFKDCTAYLTKEEMGQIAFDIIKMLGYKIKLESTTSDGNKLADNIRSKFRRQ